MTMAKRLLPLLWALLTVAVVAGVVAFGMKRLDERDVTIADPAAPPPSTRPAAVAVGHDYYVLVKLVEFNPHKPSGSSWDVDGGAPDAKVLIFWHGQQVFSLPQRSDELISTWDLFRVNLPQVALSGGNVDIASSINAPIIRAEAGEPLRVEVWDADLFRDDLAARVTLRLDDLHEGENDVRLPGGCGLRRMVVQVVDRQTSLSDLITLAGKR